MKTLSLLALLAAFIYYHGSSQSASTAKDPVAAPAPNRVVAEKIIVAATPSYPDRWKTACTDLKTGPNAQVTFEPFLPDSQANWNQNQNPGYTIVSGGILRR